MLTTDLLYRYRQDSGFPQNASSTTSGFSGGVSVYTKPLFVLAGQYTQDSPQVSQNQDTNPRQQEVVTDGSVKVYATFDSKAFIIFAVIVAAIWFLS